LPVLLRNFLDLFLTDLLPAIIYAAAPTAMPTQAVVTAAEVALFMGYTS